MIENNITVIVIILAAVLGLSVALIVYLLLRIRRIEAECDLLTRGTQGKNFVEIVNDNIEQVSGLLGEVDVLSEQYAGVLRRIAGAVQHVGVVRYDAFRGMGGMMSFSVALLDDRGNGITLSSIYGRSESRTYAKPIVERGSTYELSPEEREAIRLAMQSKEYGALPIVARDREHEERLANLRLFHEKEPGLEERTGEEQDVANRPEQQEPWEAEDREHQRPRPATGARSRLVVRHQRSRTDQKPLERTGTRAPERLWREREGVVGRTPDQQEPQRSRRTPEVDDRPYGQEEPRILGGEELLSEDFQGDIDTQPRRTGQRPRGLNTPVERLRDREPGGD